MTTMSRLTTVMHEADGSKLQVRQNTAPESTVTLFAQSDGSESESRPTQGKDALTVGKAHRSSAITLDGEYSSF